jgi:hypothetical protein
MLGIDSLWKWSVDGIEGHTKSGKAPSHAAGIKAPSARSTKPWRRKETLAPSGRAASRAPVIFPLPSQASHLGSHPIATR